MHRAFEAGVEDSLRRLKGCAEEDFGRSGI
jgi:hypothetical protein